MSDEESTAQESKHGSEKCTRKKKHDIFFYMVIVTLQKRHKNKHKLDHSVEYFMFVFSCVKGLSFLIFCFEMQFCRVFCQVGFCVLVYKQSIQVNVKLARRYNGSSYFQPEPSFLLLLCLSTNMKDNNASRSFLLRTLCLVSDWEQVNPHLPERPQNSLSINTFLFYESNQWEGP